MSPYRSAARSRFALLGAAILTCTPAATHAAEFTPATLDIATTDGNNRSVAVRSAKALRDAIKPCLGKWQCEEISIETCDRCLIYAAAVEGGYYIYSRPGPPGPLYQLTDNRAARRGSRVFNLRDATTILIDHLAGRETIPVGRRDTDEI